MNMKIMLIKTNENRPVIFTLASLAHVHVLYCILHTHSTCTQNLDFFFSVLLLLSENKSPYRHVYGLLVKIDRIFGLENIFCFCLKIPWTHVRALGQLVTKCGRSGKIQTVAFRLSTRGKVASVQSVGSMDPVSELSARLVVYKSVLSLSGLCESVHDKSALHRSSSTCLSVV